MAVLIVIIFMVGGSALMNTKRVTGWLTPKDER